MKSQYVAAVAVVSLALASCTPPPSPPTDQTLNAVTASVTLPAACPLDPATMKVLTSYGDGELTLDANGRFAALAPLTGSLQVDLVNADGKILLMGQITATGGEISPRQTAIILAFYALGGFTLPPENHDALMAMLATNPAMDPLTQMLEARLAANPTAIADGDAELDAAVSAARTAVLGSPTAKSKLPGLAALQTVKPGRAQTASGGLTIEPATQQSGIEMLQNPSGGGIIAQNSFRRYATFLLYQTATEDEQGNKSTISPPQAVGSAHDIPSTSRLEFFSAISDIFTGHAPFEPVRTDGVDLPLVSGSAKTYYDVVVLGSAIEAQYPPIFQDSRYFPVTAEWNSQLDRLRFKMFWLDFAWPAIETFLFVRGAAGQQAKTDAFVTEFKSVCDKHLGNLGVILRNNNPQEGGPAIALHLALNALRDNQAFRLELIDACKRALEQSALNQANFEAMAKKLSGRASAAAIVAAIQVALTVGDLSAVIKDLNGSRSGEVWTAIVTSPPVRLDPNPATVTLNQPSAMLTTTVGGATTGTFLYRWSTTGAHGVISDVHGQQGTSFDSAYNAVNYMANVGAIINGNMDTVTVQVYQNDGSGAIGATSTYLGKATSQITGQRDDDDDTGPVIIEADSLQPSADSPSLLNVVITDATSGQHNYHIRWTTTGNHGTLDNGRTVIEDDSAVFYYPSASALDQQTDTVTVEVTRVSDGELVGSDQVTMDIWNPTTLYSICGDSAGQEYARLGSGSSWDFFVVGHNRIMGGGCYARSGSQVRAVLQCNSAGGCYFTGYNDIGPVYMRRGAVGNPPDASVLIASKGDYGCTPTSADEPWCTILDVTVTLP